MAGDLSSSYQESEVKQGQDCKVVCFLRQSAVMFFKASLDSVKAVFWYFLCDEEEPKEDPSAKTNKKNKKKKSLLSRRFIRIASLFGSMFLALFVVGFLKMMGLTPAPKLPGFTYLNVSNHKQLKAAMSKSGPRIIYCKNVRLPPELYRVASHTVNSLPQYINRFALDCSAKLPSGRTAYERFEVNPDTTIMIMQAHGKKAKAINEFLLTNPQMFYSMVVNDTQYALRHVYNVDQFNESINQTSNRLLLVSTDGRKLSLYSKDQSDAISRIVDSNRLYNITTWIINNGLYEISFDESDNAPTDGSFCLYCIVPHEDKYIIGYFNGEPLGKAMNAFMRNCSTVSQPNRDFKPLSSLPVLTNKAINKKGDSYKNDTENEADTSNDQEEVLEL